MTLPDADNQELLHRIHAAFDVLGIHENCSAVPLVPEGFEAFRGRKILLVDDADVVFRAFVPALMAVTSGSAIFLKVRDEGALELANLIVSQSPGIVLMDGELSDHLRGFEVVKVLKVLRPDMTCIGFSSAEGFREAFMRAGATGFVEKRTGDVWGSLRGVVKVLEKG